MRIAVLALQGAFAEHAAVLQRLGAAVTEVRQLSDWQQPFDGLVLPGGESTAQLKLLRDTGLYGPVREAIADGLPVLATCAGMILLSESHLATMHIRVRRNAYGRQLGSFRTLGTVDGVGQEVPMTFIRAPYVEAVTSADCRALAVVDGHIVAARQGAQLALSFHPELDDDLRLHEYFLRMAQQ